MEYSEDIVYSILKDWNNVGYTDNLLIKNRMFYSLALDEFFPVSAASIDHQVYFTSPESHDDIWSVAAINLASTKGVLVYSNEFFDDSELTPEIKTAFDVHSHTLDAAMAS